MLDIFQYVPVRFIKAKAIKLRAVGISFSFSFEYCSQINIEDITDQGRKAGIVSF